MSTNPPLPHGYSAIPPGKLATIVTFLEMRQKPPRKAIKPMERPMLVERWEAPDLDEYRALFREIGEDWLWCSRLFMADQELSANLADPRIELYRLLEGRRVIGMLELDFRQEGACEIVYFGLVRDAVGQGLGRFLMDQAVARAWKHPIERLWLHTCTFDHPAAVAFYQRCGFSIYDQMIEVEDDPRLSGHLPMSAASHVPLARS